MRSVLEKLISNLYIGYLEFVYKTSNIEVDCSFEDREKIKNCILGFWHGDSYTMNLLMREVVKGESDVSVVVTADERGDYIEKMLNHFNMKALRMPDGIKMKSFLRELNDESKKENSTLVISLDGPIGPLHEPKKIGFKLSNTSGKNFMGVKLDIQRKILLKNRWDNYLIPLPFSKMKFTIVDFGTISREDLVNFSEYKEKVKLDLLDNNVYEYTEVEAIVN